MRKRLAEYIKHLEKAEKKYRNMDYEYLHPNIEYYYDGMADSLMATINDLTDILNDHTGETYVEGEIIVKQNYKSHKLKIDKQYLDALLEGTKTFEIRYNDRDYKVGDYLIFENKHKFKITYITDYEQKEGYVVMSVERVE